MRGLLAEPSLEPSMAAMSPRAAWHPGCGPALLADATAYRGRCRNGVADSVFKSATFIFEKKVRHVRKTRPRVTCHKEKITIKINAVKSNNVIKF